MTDPTLGQALHTRLSLAALEFEVERARLRRSLLLGAVVVSCIAFSLLALQGLLVALLWDRAGPWTLAALAAAWGVTGLLSGLNWSHQHQTGTLPFAQTAAVLRDDMIGLGSLVRGRQP